jgi:hypothetical protein
MLQPLLQIVPPGSGGVRDFALALQSQWAQAGQASDLWSLNATSVRSQALLHFSGYGYHRRGLCFWLLRELRLAQQHAAGKLHLVVMFHELFASSPPWQSAFWLKPAQSHIAKKLAGLADAVWTNSEHHAQWLSQHTAAHAVLHVQPVFSTMGEPVAVSQPSTRAAGLVVFGSASTRQRALALLAQHLPLVRPAPWPRRCRAISLPAS